MIIHYHTWSCMIIHVPHVAYVTVQVPWAKTQHQVPPQTIPDPHLVQLLQTEHCAWARLGSKSRQRQISGWFCQLPLSTQCRNMYNKIEEEPTVLYIYIYYIHIYNIYIIYIYSLMVFFYVCIAAACAFLIDASLLSELSENSPTTEECAGFWGVSLATWPIEATKALGILLKWHYWYLTRVII